MKRFTCTSLGPRSTTLYVYAADAASAAIKAHRAGFVIGVVVAAGEYDSLRNVIVERAHVNGKNGTNGHYTGANR